MHSLLFILLLLAAAIFDMKTRTIPPVIPLLVACTFIITPNWSLAQGLLGGLLTGAALLIPTLIVPDAFGGGDIKLVAACGFILGVQCSLFGLLLAIVFSFIPCAYYQFTKKQTKMAFPPYLAAGYAIAALI